MKKSIPILLLGLLLGGAGFSGFYYYGTADCRWMMHEAQPELAWLKKEFKLSDAEFARVSQLHAAYMPQCAVRCQRIDAQNQRLRELFAQSTNVTAEIQALLTERAKTRADCEAEMMKHFLEVSRTMPPEQGKRYLAWVEEQTFLHGQGMEERHHSEKDDQTRGEHHM